MTTLRIALLQLTACGTDQDANLRKGEEACRAARAMDADIALFPEMWNIGYTSYWPQQSETPDLWRAPELWEDEPRPETNTSALQSARRAWQRRAIGRDDPFVMHFRHLARELEMAIALTYLERWPGAPRNSVTLIDRQGEPILTYAKVHICDFSPFEDALSSGESFPVCTLNTRAGDVRLGAMICYDREFPESARALMLGGAEIILVPNACDMEMHRLGQLRARAWENLVGIALANYAAPKCNGHSVAFDPIAFDRHGASRDTVIVEAGEHEEIVIADFDLDALRDTRRRETLGGAFRRPETYGALTRGSVSPPFVRVNQRGEPWRPGPSTA